MHTQSPFVLSVAALLVGCAARQPAAVDGAAPDAAPAAASVPAPGASLAAVLASDHRSGANRARDRWRNPQATLEFCGLQPGHTVVELSPGGGWYTEILAPYLRDRGTLVVGPPHETGPGARYRQRFLDLVAAGEGRYDQVVIGTFDPPHVDLGASGSADLVLTFRNTHIWVEDAVEPEAYAAVFDVLRPGGTFCVVQHRAPEGDEASVLERAKTGYVRQAYVVEVAERAGFRLDAASEINANPNDTTEHPKGVWTLPPSLDLGDTDRERYLAIGESDRMTLRFVKPG